MILPVVSRRSLFAFLLASILYVFLLGPFSYSTSSNFDPKACETNSTEYIETATSTNRDIHCALPPEGQNNEWYPYEKGGASAKQTYDATSDTVFIFVHGWNSDSSKAWLYEDKNGNAESWPHLIKTDKVNFPNVDIFLAGYPTNLNSGAIGAAEASKRLWFAISLEHPEVLQRKNIIFICHSAGGIITRHMLVHNHQHFKDKKVGLILIGSPSYGAGPAGLFSPLARLYENKFALELQVGSDFLDELDTNFKDLRNSGRIPNLMGVEAIEQYGLFHNAYIPDWLNVLDRDSAGRYFGALQTMENTDHQTVASPKDGKSPAHKLLLRFYKRFKSIPRSSQFDNHVRLNVGISSEYGEALRRALRLYESARNVTYELHGGSFTIHVDLKPEYGEAYTEFKNVRRYDIVMMDDPWIPELSSKLTDLSKLDAYQSFFANNKFEDVFLPSLLRSCKAKENGNTLYALPVLANVQMFLYKPPGKSSFYTRHHEEVIIPPPKEFFKTIGKKQLVVRHKTFNESVSIFWSILRWLGFRDDARVNGNGTGPIVIPKNLANDALEWLRKADQISNNIDYSHTGIREMEALLLENNNIIAIGWPNVLAQPAAPTNIRALNISNRPVIGAWVLGIPTASSYKEEAMEAILALTTEMQFQTYMAEKGGVPTLKDFIVSTDLINESDKSRKRNEGTTVNNGMEKQGNFWARNWPSVRHALIEGTARPRTAKWRDIEDKLGQQIWDRVILGVNKSLVDEPGLFEFRDMEDS